MEPTDVEATALFYGGPLVEPVPTTATHAAQGSCLPLFTEIIRQVYRVPIYAGARNPYLWTFRYRRGCTHQRNRPPEGGSDAHARAYSAIDISIQSLYSR